MNDMHFMRQALNLARRNLGQTWPNPAVGAVVVKEGRVLGTGATARGGRPHAEPQALLQAGAEARGATLYVSLEPCSHHGETPPCAEAIIDAGIGHVVVACRDPHGFVNGAGIARLKEADIAVTEGVCAAEAEAINAGFFSVIRRGRPLVALKIAASLDSCIATGGGESQWITGERARMYAHLLRSQYDAVLTGIGTALSDDPLLTCRLPGLEDRSPLRVVLDRQGRLPPEAALVKSAAHTPLWIITGAESPAAALSKVPGVTLLHGDPYDLSHVLHLLAGRGVTRLLVEGGAGITTSFLRDNLADRLYWFRAPLLIGGDGLAAVAGLPPLPLAERARWKRLDTVALNADVLEVYGAASGKEAA
ncbi:MAG: bifunctional diaminohydroxyphosphoribosylaminopyrimidine deaminase/5-amino-6-(5-phosphoribosylamino)uracil reductase RibD [Alphaproteobacteria bacterium]|nr:bifunctional diaminohydroxyphosphoribosylaminopyrimidine deaminase/5-amino-6-(5-phosphoribosylamino)uracil reductase RibD [Alphaproteobacteria bacterium]